MATTDIYKGVLYNDGEALTTEDLNEMQAFSDARAMDQQIGGSVGRLEEAGFLPDYSTFASAPTGTPYLYCQRGGAGFITPPSPSVNNGVTVTPGVIYQAVASASGASPGLIPYTLSASDLNVVLAVGDATNPRIDVIEVKLEYVNGGSESRDFEDDTTELLSSQNQNKTRRVQATIQVKQGTPAATPTFPTLTSGFSALGAVLVPATYNAGFAPTSHFMDTRVPLRVRHLDVLPANFIQNGTAWTLFGSNGTSVFGTNSGAGGTAWLPIPLAAHQRILGITIWAEQQDGVSSDWTSALIRRNTIGNGGTGSLTTMANVHTPMTFTTTSVNLVTHQLTFAELRDALAPPGGDPYGTANAAGLGTPLWGNGHPAGAAAGNGSFVDGRTNPVVELISNAQDSYVMKMRITYAE